MPKIFTIGVSAVLLGAFAPSLVHAEATKEYTRDIGIYNAFPFTYDQGSGGVLVQDFDYVSPTPVPEGLKSARTTISTLWGYWQLINTSGFGNYDLAPRDFSAYNGGHLRFWLKSTEDVRVKIFTGASGGEHSVLIATTGGAWKEFSIALNVGGFSLTNGELTQVRVPFFIERANANASSTSWELDHIRWTKAVSSLVLFPGSTQVNPGKRRQLTVEGRDASNEVIILYSSFTANAPAGSMNPVAPTLVTASTLTAAGSAGSGVVTARTGAVSGTSNVTVTNANLDGTFGLVSETIPGVALTVDSYVGLSSSGASVPLPIIVDDLTDFREGTKSWKTTVNTKNGEFAGWFINWGLNANPAIVKEFSNYYDGSIRFWFKAPGQLSGNLVVGIQSSNVTPPEASLSKVLLAAKYTTDGAANIFDNQWHPIAIPIRELAGARPWADIARTKVLFSIFCVGNSSSSRDFYIDNLRWDTRMPGALTSIVVKPGPITLPLSAKRSFTATGFDAVGTTVDFTPTWSLQGGLAGTLTPNANGTALYTAPASNSAGQVRAALGGTNGNASVTVAPLVINQSFNVYSDLGAGGTVGVSTGGAVGTRFWLSEPTGGAAEGVRFFRSTYTLVTNIANPLAYGNWFVEETNTSRFMNAYSNGYLRFFVRTNFDLEFAIRSSNIMPGTETSKYKLSELGVPLDGNWQLVVVSIADLAGRDVRLDLAKIQTYFAITTRSDISGTNPVPRQFDVDDVRWVTSTPPPSGSKIYAGLRAKQHPTTGLVLSYDLDLSSRAVTYDNALAVMAYTYEKDFAQAAAVLNSFKARYNAGGFAGFHDEYKWDVGAAGAPITNNRRTVGPNAWLLLAILHYRNASLDNSFNGMAGGIVDWMKSLQAADGGVKFGFNGAAADDTKSTEHNFDAYAAFNAYGRTFNYSSHTVNASNVLGWLNTKAWTGTRFLVGRTAADVANVDRALDVYSWAPLALSSFTAVLDNAQGAEFSFATSKINSNTGLAVDGFDFSRFPSAGGTEDIAADKDAVWLEGTAHMALAYLAAGNTSKWDYYRGQLGFAIFTTGPTTEALTYATNAGTAYGAGFIMDATRPAASSMAWYLFAQNKFNPFKPLAVQSAVIKNISNNAIAGAVGWSVSIPTPYPQRWKLADQYIVLDAQPITKDPWGIQIYTDNTSLSQTPRYVDPTPALTTNLDSTPAGLIQNIPGQNPTSRKLDLAWRIQDSTSPIPTAVQPYTDLIGSEGPQSFNWFFFMDRATPAIDANGDGDTSDSFDGAAFQDGQVPYSIVRRPGGIQVQQSPVPTYVPSTNPDYIYLEANFGPAAAQVSYFTKIIIEFFSE